jgi:hypothetical protein
LWLQNLVGTKQKVLVERENGAGHAENFAPVRVLSSHHPREIEDPGSFRAIPGVRLDSRFRGNDGNWVGRIVETLVTGREGEALIGAPL